MCDQRQLSEREWELVVELLRHEMSELPVEIRHTRISRVRDQLHERRELVQDLLQRLTNLTPV